MYILFVLCSLAVYFASHSSSVIGTGRGSIFVVDKFLNDAVKQHGPCLLDFFSTFRSCNDNFSTPENQEH